MHAPLTRRSFLQTSLATAASFALAGRRAAGAGKSDSFSFILLGDLHYDKLEHHDMAWLERHKPGDFGQIRNYSRITAELMPTLFAAVRATIAELNQTATTRVAFVMQVGDLVEGLCGSEDLAVRQNQEALAFIDEAQFGCPFLFTKGNHDVAGDGAEAAFDTVFLPSLRGQCSGFPAVGDAAKACYAIEHGGAQFAFFDAYQSESLDWLEAVLAKGTARHRFVIIHPPVVPYGARATWHLYSAAKDQVRRAKLLELLGQQNAFVLGGHIHKFSTLRRATPGGGRFAQLAISSVVGVPEPAPKDLLSGVEAYNGDQIRVEPRHGPGTEAQRRAVYETERPLVGAFDYADLPGFAVVTVNGAAVEARVYGGVNRRLWRTVDLSKLLHG